MPWWIFTNDKWNAFESHTVSAFMPKKMSEAYLPSAPNPLRRLCSLAQTSLPCIPSHPWPCRLSVREVLLFCSAISTRGRQRWNLLWISTVRANVSDLLPSSVPVLREPGRTVTLHSSVVSRRVGLFLSLSLLSLSPVTASHTQITLPHLSFQGRTRKDTLDWKLAFLMETICATLQREMVHFVYIYGKRDWKQS